jgi:hypothetical protein
MQFEKEERYIFLAYVKVTNLTKALFTEHYRKISADHI